MKTLLSTRRTRLILTLGLLLAFGGILTGTAFVYAVSPAGTSFFATPIPTHENIWAYVEIAKPTHTEVPAVIPPGTPMSPPASTMEEMPTVIPAETAVTQLTVEETETPGEMVMEIADGAPVSAQQESQAPAPSYNGSKYILVDISEQHMYVYENDSLLYSFVASTGMNNATRVGNFAVQSKIPNAYGSTWNIWMPNWLGIYWAGGLENGIHALPILPSGATLWEGFLGRPVSYGCVVLGTSDSQLLYDWAEIGVPVEIQR